MGRWLSLDARRGAFITAGRRLRRGGVRGRRRELVHEPFLWSRSLGHPQAPSRREGQQQPRGQQEAADHDAGGGEATWRLGERLDGTGA